MSLKQQSLMTNSRLSNLVAGLEQGPEQVFFLLAPLFPLLEHVGVDFQASRSWLRCADPLQGGIELCQLQGAKR